MKNELEKKIIGIVCRICNCLHLFVFKVKKNKQRKLHRVRFYQYDKRKKAIHVAG